MASYRNSNNVGEAAEGQQRCVQAALITRHPSRLPGACQPADNLLWRPVLSVLRACLLGLCNSQKLDQQRQGMASAAQGRGTPCNQTQSLGGRPGFRLGQDKLQGLLRPCCCLADTHAPSHGAGAHQARGSA